MTPVTVCDVDGSSELNKLVPSNVCDVLTWRVYLVAPGDAFQAKYMEVNGEVVTGIGGGDTGMPEPQPAITLYQDS